MRSLKKIFPVLFILLIIGTSSVFAEGESVTYKGHVQDIGWMDYVSDGATAGTTGQSKRVEAVKIKLVGFPEGSHIEYSPHVEDYGWMSYVKDDELGGTEGQCKRVEAFKIRLTGPASETHDVYYRTHIEDFGWLGWAKNDEVSGTSGYAKRMEAIEIKVVPKGDPEPGTTGTPSLEKDKINAGDTCLKNGAGINYSSYIRGNGWQDTIKNGITGTEGKSLPLESFKASLNNLDGNVAYTAHVSDIGWTEPFTNGQECGPANSGKQIEAITISLSGNVANQYNVFYRTHVADIGWSATRS